MKALIFDSSTIITLAMNGLLDILEKLKKQFRGKFILTRYVEYETITRPMNTKKFELNALNIKNLLDKKILEMPDSLGITDDKIKAEMKQILNVVNATFSSHEKFMHIIDEGEASCIALSILASKKGIENAVAVDERTLRMLYEKPENLHKLLEKKLHTNIKANRQNFSFFKNLNIKLIRSAEIVYVAYKKGLIDLKNHGSVLDALLYAAKFKGCSISQEEIEEIKRM